MSLPAPNLDDRDWEVLVEDAKRRIAAKCPGWTDFNPSDPGMALVDVMAWMTETVLYRLNRVPDLNYVKFLDLIGVRLQPARPARAWAFFSVQKGVNEDDLRRLEKGTRVSTRPQSGALPVGFLTCETLHLTARAIAKTCSMYAPTPTGGTRRAVTELAEVHHLTGSTPWETEIFHLESALTSAGSATVPHNLYLGDPDLAYFGTQTVVEIRAEVAESSPGQSPLQWEAWDGQSWQNVSVEDDTQGLRKNGILRFKDLPTLGKCARNKLHPPLEVSSAPTTPPPEAYWLRARLVGLEADNPPRLAKLWRRISSQGCIRSPARAFSKAPLPTVPAVGQTAQPTPQWQALDTSTSFAPFGTTVKQGSLFCFASDLFQRRGDTISVRFGMEKTFPAENGIEIDWEYPSQNGEWRPLGRSTSEKKPVDEGGFEDGTLAFTQDGELTFSCPPDIDRVEIAGQAGWYIRARMQSLQNTSASIVDVRAPALLLEALQIVVRTLLVGAAGTFQPWKFCVSENYGQFADCPDGTAFTPFQLQADQDPAFYLCFDGRPSVGRGPYGIYLDVVPCTADAGVSGMVWQRDASGWNWQPAAPALLAAAPRLVWEHAAGTSAGNAPAGAWQELKLRRDGTESLTRPGAVEFFSSEDWVESTNFKQKGYWLRVRWQAAEFLRPPRLRRVALNAVEVEQTTLQEWVLGSSDASPNQSFSLGFSVLDYPEMWVREDDLTGAEIRELQTQDDGQGEQRLSASAGTTIVKEEDGWWVRWTEVMNFHRSATLDGGKARDFRADLETGTFSFGDGDHGSIPPAGRRNVCVVYRVTQGAKGNAGANTINVLEKSEFGVAEVNNYYSAQGGADPEDIEQAKRRGPWEIAHGGRAVTKQDFEALAQKSSQLVGKAFCREDDGTVRLVIVPTDQGVSPRPSQYLLEQVQAYLDARRLINTRLSVEAPSYQLIDVKVNLVLRPTFDGEFSDVAAAVVQALNQFVHPMTGSDDGSGWEMGRAVHKSELYYLIERVPAVKYVDKLEIRRTGGQAEDRVAIDPLAFPCFNQQMSIARV